MLLASNKNSFDKRTRPRRPYSGDIFFTSKNGLNEGKLKNFSLNGLFIETAENLLVGEILTIAMPHIKGKKIKFKGQIIWRNKHGCGIELFKKRSNTNLRIIR